MVSVCSCPGHSASYIIYHNLAEFLNDHKPIGAVRSLGEYNAIVLLSISPTLDTLVETCLLGGERENVQHIMNVIEFLRPHGPRYIQL